MPATAMHDAHSPSAPPTAEQVAQALDHIERSRAFAGSARHRALLRHLVERWLAGDAGALKESVIAVEVFGREAGRFDPRSDSIVRVETRRLRTRLARHAQDEGRDAALRIELPVGSYVPHLAWQLPPPQRTEATRRARDLVERGEYFLRQALSPQAPEQALERFDAALRESPGHVPALVGAGRAWLNLALGWYREPQAAAEHAAEALRQALALEPDQAQAHALLGAIEHSFEHDWPAARRSFERAIAIDPGLAFARSAFGRHLLFHGDLVEAEQQLALARQLDPQYVNTRMHMVNLRIAQRRFGDAQAELDAMCDIAPASMPVAGLEGLLALVRGEVQQALAHYRRACELAPGHPACEASLAAALGAAGRIDEADALMAGLLQAHGAQVLSPYVRGIVAARCGRRDEALAHLQRSIELGDPNAIMMPADPSLATLHDDARWPALLVALARPRPG